MDGSDATLFDPDREPGYRCHEPTVRAVYDDYVGLVERLADAGFDVGDPASREDLRARLAERSERGLMELAACDDPDELRDVLRGTAVGFLTGLDDGDRPDWTEADYEARVDERLEIASETRSYFSGHVYEQLHRALDDVDGDWGGDRSVFREYPQLALVEADTVAAYRRLTE